MTIYQSLPLLLLMLTISCGCSQKTDEHAESALNSAVTNSSNAPLVQPPDVLSATNLEQWKFLIKDLKQNQTRVLQNYWETDRFRAGSPPVLLRQNKQTIIYKAETIQVITLPHTADFLMANLHSPKMNIEETRELGLKLCGMFGFDSDKFTNWCHRVENGWLDAPNFKVTDSTRLRGLEVRTSYNDKRPWYINFSVSDEAAVSKLMGKSLP